MPLPQHENYTTEDIYHLPEYEDEIVNMDGFGRKSYDNIIENIEKVWNGRKRLHFQE